MTQPTWNEVRRRLPVCSSGCAYFLSSRDWRHKQHSTERGLAQGSAASWASVGVFIASSHCIPSHPITSPLAAHAREGRKSPTHSHYSLTFPYLYPPAILGHAPSPPALPWPAPACLNFPYLAQLHRHNSHIQSLPGLRHGASKALSKSNHASLF